MAKTSKYKKSKKINNKFKKNSKTFNKTKKIKKQNKKIKIHMKGGFNNFPITEINNSNDLFNIIPGQSYKFFGFKLSFYDFDLLEHKPFKEIISKKSIQQTCRWQINDKYYREKLNIARFLLTITFIDTNDGSEEIDSFIMANEIPNNSNNDLYISLSCSRENWSEKKQGQEKKNFKLGNIQTGFGTLLMCILLNYVKTIGFNDIYLSAAEYNLINYYKKWGFRLNKNKCGIFDELTNKHELAISKNINIPEIELDEFKKSSGYDMKLCGNDTTKICNYAKKQLSKLWIILPIYDDIYYSS